MIEQAGADVNTKTKYAYTPLILACKNGSIDLCKYLIEHGADVKMETEFYDGTTLLIAACESRSIELCKYLIENGADVNIKAETESDYGTPLIVACRSGNIELCKYLIE